MNKIGIVTLPGEYNYGNRLQAYAQIKIFNSLGYNAEIIELPQNRDRLIALKNAIKKAVGRPLEEDFTKFTTPERQKAFARFRNNIPTRIFKRPKDVPITEYDYFSCGSDQIWNPSFISLRDREYAPLRIYHNYKDRINSSLFLEWYCLGFCPPDKRIALAPSIGLDFVDAAQERLIRLGVNHFNCLSVRECAGAEIIRKCSGRNPAVICDPTLILDNAAWRLAADDRLTPRAPYIFTYLLGNANIEANRVIEKVCVKDAFSVISLSDRAWHGEVHAGPAEFISLIDRAEHVVTDSFHAAVFASILQTPLTIVHRAGGASMFSRLEQLSHMLGIEHKIYGSPEFDLSKAGDYEGVPEAIERERARFMEYLEGCLDA